MKSANCKSIARIACILLATLSFSFASASDIDDLTAMLHGFLKAAHKEAAHRDFWAEDLVYTSSNGTRFGKAEILAGFADSGSAEDPPTVVYSAEDIDVRVFDAAAVVAFRLVGVPADASGILEYLNTGTFLKREGSWEVVAWQATAIPAVDEKPD